MFSSLIYYSSIRGVLCNLGMGSDYSAKVSNHLLIDRTVFDGENGINIKDKHY